MRFVAEIAETMGRRRHMSRYRARSGSCFSRGAERRIMETLRRFLSLQWADFKTGLKTLREMIANFVQSHTHRPRHA